NRCRINRIASLRHGADVEYGKLTGIRIVTEVVAKGPFDSAFARRYDAFEYDLRSCGYHHVQRLRAHQRYALPANKSGECHLVDVFGQRKDGSHHQYRIGSDDYSYLQILSIAFRFPIVTAPAFHTLPVHARLVFAKYLQPVKAEVAALCLWMLGQCHSICNE